MNASDHPSLGLAELTDRLLATYEVGGKISHLGSSPLPSVPAVIDILQELNEVIFPGFRVRQDLHRDNVPYHVGALLDGVHEQLSEQVARALRHREDSLAAAGAATDGRGDWEQEGRAVSLQFLQSLPDVRAVLADDVQAAYDGDPAADGLDEIVLCYPGLQAITVYRLAHELHRLGVPLIPRIMSEWAHRQTGIDIHPGAEIGRAFFIDHGTGVVIGETCEIADNVKLYQGVTLGALSFPKDAAGNLVRKAKRHPTIEENVIIYANATVLGGKTVVGANSIIGAGVSLNRSVPPNTIVTIEKPSLRFREAA